MNIPEVLVTVGTRFPTGKTNIPRRVKVDLNTKALERKTVEVEINPEISTTIVRIEISHTLRTTDETVNVIVIAIVIMIVAEIEIGKGNETGIVNVIAIVTGTEIETAIVNGIETELVTEIESGTAENVIVTEEIETAEEAKVEPMAGMVNQEATPVI